MPHTETTYRDEETLLDNAYSIFLELASDNLSPEYIALFNNQFAEHGVLALHAPFSDWSDYLNEEIELTEFSEVVVGLQDDNQQLVQQFATILVPKDTQENLCHIIWTE